MFTVSDTLDVIGIGLGPFNLSLAALLDESVEQRQTDHQQNTQTTQTAPKLMAKFFEQDSGFNWHKGIMLPSTTLQVPFLADLVSLIDPTSRYSFLNYLHTQQRLLKFYFVEDFFVARKEYNHYCQWVASQLNNVVFNATVVDVVRDKQSGLFTVTVNEQGKTKQYMANNIVIGTGTYPTLPPALQAIANIAPNRCMHTANFLHHFDLNTLISDVDHTNTDPNTNAINKPVKPLPKILVVGSGQSAAEAYKSLFEQQLTDNGAPKFELDWLTRSAGFFPMEYSPLGLEHFSPAYTDYFYQLSSTVKQALLSKQDLLYKGMGFSTIQDIYKKLYERTLTNAPLHSKLISNCAIKNVQLEDNKLRVTVYQQQQNKTQTAYYDCIVAGTGYQHRFADCCTQLLKQVKKENNGKPKITRDYQLTFVDDSSIDNTKNRQVGRVFVQNQELHSHGVGTPDLGLGAYRAGVIANQLLNKNKYNTQALTVFQQFGI